MSREETMKRDRFRVQAFDGEIVKREGLFDDEKTALAFFDTMGPYWDLRRIQVRRAGEARYETVLRKAKGAT
jgi:hypothetical protein